MARDDTDRDDDRGFFDRAADEARSWFGDDDAERRRRQDRPKDRFSRYDGPEADRYRRNFEVGDEADRRSHEGYPSGRFFYEDRDSSRGDRRRDPRNYGDYDYGRRMRSSGQEYRGEDRDRALYAPTGSGMDEYSTNRDSGANRGYDRTGDYSGGTYDHGEGSGREDRSGRDDRMGGSYRSGRDYRSGDSGSPRVSHAGRGPQGYSRSTDRIAEDVNESLMDDHDVDATSVRVSVDNGEVTLEGTVRSRSEKRQAENVAERVRGVRDVHNRLRVSDDTSMSGDAETLGDQVNAALGTGAAGRASGETDSKAS